MKIKKQRLIHFSIHLKYLFTIIKIISLKIYTKTSLQLAKAFRYKSSSM